MKLIAAFLILLPVFASSQYKVTIIVDKLPAQTTDKIYLCGNFNQFNPADPDALLLKNSAGKFTKDFMDVESGQYEFRFTQGSMESIECKSDGTDLANRQVTINSDTVIHFTIARWKNEKNLNESEKNGKNNLQQISNTVLLFPRIELYAQRLKFL
jgi:hypothetical protein